MHARTANHLRALEHDLVGAFVEAGIDCRVRPDNNDSGVHLVVELDDQVVSIEIKERAAPTRADIDALPDPPADGRVLSVLMADRISESDRAELARRGWGFLDRRGFLRVWGPGVRIDTTIRSRLLEKPRAANPFTPAGRALALNLLARAGRFEEPPRNLTEYARSVLHVSAGRVSELSKAFREIGLLDDDGEPAIPELFWALAEHWKPTRVPLLAAPDPRSRRDLDLAAHEWVRCGDSAAAIWGVPVLYSADPTADFYVDSDTTLHVAALRLGRAGPSERAECTVAVPPARLNDAWIESGHDGFRLAEPVVVALDLAVDGRGREAIRGWDDIDHGYRRVW